MVVFKEFLYSFFFFPGYHKSRSGGKKILEEITCLTQEET